VVTLQPRFNGIYTSLRQVAGNYQVNVIATKVPEEPPRFINGTTGGDHGVKRCLRIGYAGTTKSQGSSQTIGTLFLKQGTLLCIPFLRRGFLSFMLDTCPSFAYYPMH
jgi:hypothetical protein